MDARARLNLDPHVYDSNEACFKEEGKSSCGRSAYSSILLTHLNNENLREIYTMKYKGPGNSTARTGSYELIFSTAGQYMRLVVALKIVDSPMAACESVVLFSNFCDREVMKVFSNNFKQRCCITTVHCKANQLLKLCTVKVDEVHRSAETANADTGMTALAYIRQSWRFINSQ